MERPETNQIISLTINGLGHFGEGVGHIDGYTVFVDGALPQEVVQAQIIESKQRYASARLLSLIKDSSDRISPRCKLFGRCGGCQLMHLSYSKQLDVKRQKVVDALLRIGKISDCTVHPCLPSLNLFSYRNKIQVPIKNGQLGFYAKSSHDLVEVDTCPIHCELGDQVYQRIKTLIHESEISSYDPNTKKGELRHLLIKTAVHSQEVLVVLVTAQKKSPKLSQLAQKIMELNPSIKGVVQNFHQGKENVILGDEYKILQGQGFIQERLCGLQFKISPASFFQVNPYQAECLYLKALEYADLKGDETVLDAYCGVGTLSLIFAKQAEMVIGVECVPEAIEDAIENQRLNQINNVKFVCAPSEIFISSLKQMDLILLNPPRKGCEPTFLKEVGRLKPKKLIYISCDPATLARDLSILISFGYQIDIIQPFDMFPQTSHVECVVRLKME